MKTYTPVTGMIICENDTGDYVKRSELHNKRELSWKNVLYPHATLGHISVMIEYTKKLDYQYFCWNGHIYDQNGHLTEWTTLDVS